MSLRAWVYVHHVFLQHPLHAVHQAPVASCLALSTMRQASDIQAR